MDYSGAGDRPAADDDDTVRVRRGPRARRPRRWPILLAVAVCLIGGAIAGYLESGPPPVSIDTESEAAIDAAQPCGGVKVSHFAPAPDIVVIDFPSLTAQGLTLNRVAALIEKAGTPRDRVLDDVQLTQAISDCGDTVESYYYGHDYKAADLRRFFRLAAAEGIKLNPEELWLKRLLRQLGWLQADAAGAIISLPAAGGPITEEMRAVILHHEISHGAFYTIPAYQAYAEGFWHGLTPADRAAFTGFLGRQGYDMHETELMLNETQAYLIFTRDPQFFNGGAVGMTSDQISTLRANFIPDIPVDWLRPMANAPLPVAAKIPACST